MLKQLTGLLLLLSGPVLADGPVMRLVNHSTPTLCAEEDNVDLRLSGPVAGYRVEAEHPAYIGALAVDRYAPDFTNCPDMAKNPDFTFTPRRVTLAESERWQVVGHTFARFWRGDSVPVRIGGQEWRDLHLIQLWTRVDERAEEVLVLYPADGYWRLRPLPPAHLRWSAYGTSVLIGPVEEAGRPVVALSGITIDPNNQTFTVDFVKGGRAVVRLADLTREKIAVDVRFSGPVPTTYPLAAMRSMFVTSTNADAAQVFWRRDARWQEQPVMEFVQSDVVEMILGRTAVSRHNSSAPDVKLGGFIAASD